MSCALTPIGLISGIFATCRLTDELADVHRHLPAHHSARPTRGAGFSGMGNKLATFYFADVRLQAGGRLGMLPAGTSLAARNLPNIAYSRPGFHWHARTPGGIGCGFARAGERRITTRWSGFVRTNCGYPGLIFGTIMANSPATVQSKMDVIDGHAYWKHPDSGPAMDS